MTDQRTLANALAAVMRTVDADRIAAEIYEAVRRRPDRQSLFSAFRDAGIERVAAETIATEIFEAIRLARA